MRFFATEIGRTRDYTGDRLLIVIDGLAHMVERTNDEPKLLGTVPWLNLQPLFPFAEEQKTGDAYLRHTWAKKFLEAQVHPDDLFKIVPTGKVLGIPPKQPSGDPQWIFHPAGTRVLKTEFDRGRLLKEGQTIKVAYQRSHDMSLGSVQEQGHVIWTNRGGKPESQDFPDPR